MSSDKEAKLKALKLTMDKLDKTYGKGAVMRMGDDAVEEVEVIPRALWAWMWPSVSVAIPAVV